MKKIATFTFILMITLALTAGVAYTDLKGTYSTQLKTDAPLTWNAYLSNEGKLIIQLLEDGSEKRLSTLTNSLAKYNVTFKNYGYKIVTLSGKITKINGVFNAVTIELGSHVEQFEGYTTPVTISITDGISTYNLGSIDITGIISSLYDYDIEGSAGGYIFYDKGYDSDGWRFLEAAPADIALIEGTPSVDSSEGGYKKGQNTFVFGYTEDEATTPRYSENSATSFETGKANTSSIVSRIGDEAVFYNNSWLFSDYMIDNYETYVKWDFLDTSDYEEYKGYTWYYAAKVCEDLEYSDGENTYDDWYLPSSNELELIKKNLICLGRGVMADDSYWSSSEGEYNQTAYILSYDSGYTTRQSFKNNAYHVRPVRSFSSTDEDAFLPFTVEYSFEDDTTVTLDISPKRVIVLASEALKYNREYLEKEIQASLGDCSILYSSLGMIITSDDISSNDVVTLANELLSENDESEEEQAVTTSSPITNVASNNTSGSVKNAPTERKILSFKLRGDFKPSINYKGKLVEGESTKNKNKYSFNNVPAKATGENDAHATFNIVAEGRYHFNDTGFVSLSAGISSYGYSFTKGTGTTNDPNVQYKTFIPGICAEIGLGMERGMFYCGIRMGIIKTFEPRYNEELNFTFTGYVSLLCFETGFSFDYNATEKIFRPQLVISLSVPVCHITVKDEEMNVEPF